MRFANPAHLEKTVNGALGELLIYPLRLCQDCGTLPRWVMCEQLLT